VVHRRDLLGAERLPARAWVQSLAASLHCQNSLTLHLVPCMTPYLHFRDAPILQEISHGPSMPRWSRASGTAISSTTRCAVRLYVRNDQKLGDLEAMTRFLRFKRNREFLVNLRGGL
jgi:hypothetical protein